jgi:hypothetical protein
MNAPAVSRLTQTRRAPVVNKEFVTYWDETNGLDTPVIVEFDINGIRDIDLRAVRVDMPGEKGPCILSLLSELEKGEIDAAVCDRINWRESCIYE